MFGANKKCTGCEALSAENARLHGLINRLLDKVAGPELPKDEVPMEPAPPPPEERIEHEDGTVEEITRYGV